MAFSSKTRLSVSALPSLVAISMPERFSSRSSRHSARIATRASATIDSSCIGSTIAAVGARSTIESRTNCAGSFCRMPSASTSCVSTRTGPRTTNSTVHRCKSVPSTFGTSARRAPAAAIAPCFAFDSPAAPVPPTAFAGSAACDCGLASVTRPRPCSAADPSIHTAGFDASTAIARDNLSSIRTTLPSRIGSRSVERASVPSPSCTSRVSTTRRAYSGAVTHAFASTTFGGSTNLIDRTSVSASRVTNAYSTRSPPASTSRSNSPVG